MPYSASRQLGVSSGWPPPGPSLAAAAAALVGVQCASAPYIRPRLADPLVPMPPLPHIPPRRRPPARALTSIASQRSKGGREGGREGGRDGGGGDKEGKPHTHRAFG